MVSFFLNSYFIVLSLVILFRLLAYDDKEDPHCFGDKELNFCYGCGIFVKRGTVPTRVVQYSLGHTIIFVSLARPGP